jgi:hypothetical protein
LAGRSARRLYGLLGKFEGVRARRIVLVAALVLVAPAVASGFALDDYVLLYQMARPDGEWAGSAPFDLFRWMDPAHDLRLIDGAGMPWWTFEGAKCAFLRPLSSLSHALDHWLWPHSAFWMHVHSLVWFALLLFVAFKVYAALLDSRWVAGAACAMFALDSAHGATVGWISNRNALISAAFGIAALLCHHRRRSGAGFGFAVAAWGCFALSLSSAELGVAVLGYLLVYALLFEQGSLRPRLVSVVPYAMVFVAWSAIRSAAHYGSFGLGAYVDPIAEPWGFAKALPSRSLVLMSSQISRLGSDLYDLVPAPVQPLVLAWALIVCGAMVWFLWPSLRTKRSTRFWAVGAVLSVLPLAATVPSDRLLTLVGFGVMPLLAQAMHDALQAAREVRADTRTSFARAAQLRVTFALMLAFVHCVVDPALLPLVSLSPALIAKGTETTEASLSADAALRDQTVIVAEVPDSVMLSYLPVMRSFNGKPRPDKLYWLAATHASARFERRGPNMLRVTSEAGFFDRRSEARSPQFPLRKGDRVELSQMTVQIVELTRDGRPSVCDFVFALPLESPSYLWRTWRDGRLQPFHVPAEGESVRYATSSTPDHPRT